MRLKQEELFATTHRADRDPVKATLCEKLFPSVEMLKRFDQSRHRSEEIALFLYIVYDASGFNLKIESVLKGCKQNLF